MLAALASYRLGNIEEKALRREERQAAAQQRAEEKQKQLDALLAEQEKQESERLKQWLATHAVATKAPSAVDLTAVQVYGSPAHRLVRTWTHLKFWAIKRDVCQPYEK